MDRITELRQKRAGIVENMRALLDAAAAESRDLNADENQNYQNMEAELGTLEAQIAREERVSGLEADLRQSANGGRNPGRDRQPGGRDTRTARANETEEYRDAFLRFLVSGQPEQGLVREQRDVLGLGLGSANGYGSYLAPTALERVLVNEITQENVLRQIADVRTSATDVDIPIANAHPTAYLVAEGASITASSPTFTRKQMKAYKLAALSYVTWEALEDIFLNYEGFIRDEFAAAFAAKEENLLVKGTGSNQPGGIEAEGTSAFNAAAAAAITADELLNLVYAVEAKYRKKGAFVMNDATVLAIRKLKTSSEQQYIWQPGLQAGQPDRLLGYPIYTSSEVDVMGAGKKPIFFGDFKKLRIQDRSGLYIQRLNEVAATTGQVGFVAHRRTDSHVIVPAAIKYITMKAS